MLLVREKFNEQWDKWKFRGGEVKMKEDVLTKVLSMCSYKESNNALKCFRPVPFKPSHFHQPENIFFLFIRIMTVIFQMFIVSTEGIMVLSNESSGTFTSWGHHIPILSPVEMQPYGRRHRSKDSVSQMDSMIRRIWAWKHKNLSIINTYFPSPLKKKKAIFSGNPKYWSEHKIHKQKLCLTLSTQSSTVSLSWETVNFGPWGVGKKWLDFFEVRF